MAVPVGNTEKSDEVTVLGSALETTNVEVPIVEKVEEVKTEGTALETPMDVPTALGAVRAFARASGVLRLAGRAGGRGPGRGEGRERPGSAGQRPFVGAALGWGRVLRAAARAVLRRLR